MSLFTSTSPQRSVIDQLCKFQEHILLWSDLSALTDQITVRLKCLITVNDLQGLQIATQAPAHGLSLSHTHTSATAALVCCECEFLRNLKNRCVSHLSDFTSGLAVKLWSESDGWSTSAARWLTRVSGLLMVMFTVECLEEQNHTDSCLMATWMKQCLFGAQFAAGLGRLDWDFKSKRLFLHFPLKDG